MCLISSVVSFARGSLVRTRPEAGRLGSFCGGIRVRVLYYYDIHDEDVYITRTLARVQPCRLCARSTLRSRLYEMIENGGENTEPFELGACDFIAKLSNSWSRTCSDL